MKYLKSIEYRNRLYYVRIQFAIACSLFLFILMFRFWPDQWLPEGKLQDRFSEQELITPEMIIASREVAVERRAPPVPRPDETLQEEVVIDMTYDLEMDVNGLNGPLPFPADSVIEEDELVEQPDRPPNVRRIVEPVMPSAARRENIRVELDILFTVSADGIVEDATVVSMRLFNRRTGQFESVEETGYGFQEVTLHAARQWLFHPAQYDGRPVRAQTRHRFTFGNGL